MNSKFSSMRDELRAYYLPDNGRRSDVFARKCFEIMDSKYSENMSVMEQKLLQYRVIVDEFEPKIFEHSPFYYETQVLSPLSDGYRKSKETKKPQANAWVYLKNKHLFVDFDPELWNRRNRQSEELMYLICGPYSDDSQHFNFNNRPVLERGLRGVYEDAAAELTKAETEAEREFLRGVCSGMLELRKMANRFAEAAAILLDAHPENENFRLIAATAARVPWEAPRTFYEALATLAFMRKAVGSLEGIGPNTFGRLDLDLYPFYERDIKKKRLTRDGAYELICRFLITWDCHYDHEMKMVMYSDHELENTYVLGGCDDGGAPVYNELTKLFLSANLEEKIIFPKVKCRFSANSTKEYLNDITRPLLTGTATFLYQNDDATIPALLRLGLPIEEARDYLVTGCWDVCTYLEKHDNGNYLNLLKPFEFALHRRFDKMVYVGMDFLTFDDSESFEELYSRVLRNCELLLRERISITARGRHIVKSVDPLPIFSSTLKDCIENRADYRNGGARYCDDYYYLFGLPDIVDSLLAIKKLVFEDKKYTLSEMLAAVRRNWEGAEDMRREAIACHGWGDGHDDSCALARRFNDDLFAVCNGLTGSYVGKVRFVHLTYTEIRFWGEKTLATPNGRKNGEYFSQGLTPSRLKRIPCVNDVVNSFSALDPSVMVNNVVNIILPPTNISSEYLEAFMRVCAGTAMQSIQLNCTSRKMLLDAQTHPEKYPDLVVRVTGFSAKFTSLSKEWQDEVISRNFYE